MEYIYLLDGEDCWDWGAVGRLSLDDGKIQQRVQESVWNHEAYKWRTSRELYYEHYALVVSLIGRLTWGTDEVDGTIESSRREQQVKRRRHESEEGVPKRKKKKRVVARKRVAVTRKTKRVAVEEKRKKSSSSEERRVAEQ